MTMEWSDLKGFSEEHAPRPEHDVPWMTLPTVGDVVHVLRRAASSLLDRVRHFDPVDAIETFGSRLRAVRELLSSRP